MENIPEIMESPKTSFDYVDTPGSTMKFVDKKNVTVKHGQGRSKKVSATPQDVKERHSRGCPVGSTKKAKGKQMDVKDPSSFIHTSVVKCHM